MSVGPIKETHASQVPQLITSVAGRFNLTSALMQRVIKEADEFAELRQQGPLQGPKTGRHPLTNVDKKPTLLNEYKIPQKIKTDPELHEIQHREPVELKGPALAALRTIYGKLDPTAIALIDKVQDLAKKGVYHVR